jgi:hypothetical protein
MDGGHGWLIFEALLGVDRCNPLYSQCASLAHRVSDLDKSFRQAQQILSALTWPCSLQACINRRISTGYRFSELDRAISMPTNQVGKRTLVSTGIRLRIGRVPAESRFGDPLRLRGTSLRWRGVITDQRA